METVSMHCYARFVVCFFLLFFLQTLASFVEQSASMIVAKQPTIEIHLNLELVKIIRLNVSPKKILCSDLLDIEFTYATWNLLNRNSIKFNWSLRTDQKFWQIQSKNSKSINWKYKIFWSIRSDLSLTRSYFVQLIFCSTFNKI